MSNQISNQQIALVISKDNLKALMEKRQVSQTLERVSTRWMSADQLRTQAVLAVARNPALLRCTQHSFLESMVRAAELGLRFAGAGGEAYLIPFKNQCSLIIGYRGLCALARRTGKVTRIEARVVYERDHFKVSYGSGQQLIHRPYLGSGRGKIICAYGLAELRDGSVQIEVMAIDEIEKIKNKSRAAENGPWRTDFSEMCRKTVLRRLCKFLPFPTAFDDALAAEEPDKDQPRKSIETQDITPENVNIQTGEIIDDASQLGTDFEYEQPGSSPAEESQPSGPQTTGQAEDSLDAQKAKLINRIVNELGKLHPGNSVEAQAASLRTLKYTFGQTQVELIAKMPIQILEAGLGALRSQAAAVVEDIPM